MALLVDCVVILSGLCDRNSVSLHFLGAPVETIVRKVVPKGLI